MPEKDYISKVYSALKDNLDGFDKDETTFRQSLSDPDYAANTYRALKDNLDGFDRSESDFYEQIGVKKKPDSEPSSGSSTGAPATTNAGTKTGSPLNFGYQTAIEAAIANEKSAPIKDKKFLDETAKKLQVAPTREAIYGKTFDNINQRTQSAYDAIQQTNAYKLLQQSSFKDANIADVYKDAIADVQKQAQEGVITPEEAQSKIKWYVDDLNKYSTLSESISQNVGKLKTLETAMKGVPGERPSMLSQAEVGLTFPAMDMILRLYPEMNRQASVIAQLASGRSWEDAIQGAEIYVRKKDPVSATLLEKSDAVQNAQNKFNELVQNARPDSKEWSEQLRQTAEDAISSTGYSIPLIAAYASGNPALAGAGNYAMFNQSAGQRWEQIKDDPNRTTQGKFADAMGHGMTEVLFEQLGAIPVAGLYKQVGKTLTKEQFADIFKDANKGAIKTWLKNQGIALGFAGEGMEELSTGMSQRAIDYLSQNEKPKDQQGNTISFEDYVYDKDKMRDEFITGAAMGMIFSAPGGVINAYSSIRDNGRREEVKAAEQQLSQLQTDIAKLPEGSGAKEALVEQANNIHQSIVNESEADYDEWENKPREIKEKADYLINENERLTADLNNPELMLSEDARKIVEAAIEANNKGIDELKSIKPDQIEKAINGEEETKETEAENISEGQKTETDTTGEGKRSLKDQLLAAGKIVVDEEGKVQDIRQNSGASSQLFKDLQAIIGDKEKAADYYLSLKEDEGPFKMEFADWENKIMRDYGRKGYEYGIARPTADELEGREDEYAWSTEKNGKPMIIFNDNLLGRDKPFKPQKEGFIKRYIDPEIEAYKQSGNKEALAKMEEYKDLFEKYVNNNRDIKLHIIHNEMYGILNAGKEITPQDIEDNYIRSVKEVDRLNHLPIAKDFFGEPMIYAHAGPEGISKFLGPQQEGYKRTDPLTGEAGIYFSRDEKTQEQYSWFEHGHPGKGRDIYYAFLRAQKPYYITDPQAQSLVPIPDIKTISKEQRERLEELGYDVIILDEEGRPKKEVVVFDPDQIELIATYNKGLLSNKVPTRKSKNTENSINNKDVVSNDSISENENKTSKAKEASETEVLGEKTERGEEESSPSSGKKKKRKLTQQMLSDKTIRPEFKSSIGEEEIYYEEIPNDVTVSEASAVIDYLGNEQAAKEVENPNNGMKPRVRNTIAQVLIKRYEAEGDYDTAIDIREKLVKSATEQGQGVQMFAMWPSLTPEGELRKMQRIINEQRSDKRKKAKDNIDEIKKGLRKINKDAAKETVENLKKPIDKASESIVNEVKRSADYGSKNKIVTKEKYLEAKRRLKGKLFMAAIPPPELIEIGAYHIEAGSRKFADFAQAMIDEFGKKVKPYLKNIYTEAHKEVGGEISSDQEIETYFKEEAGTEWQKKIDKAIQSGNIKDQQKAIARLQEIAKEEGVWGQYKKEAVNRLKRLSLEQIKGDIEANAALQDFTDGLVRNFQQKIQEGLPEAEGAKKEPRKAIEIIGDAYKNTEKYQEVWDKTKAEFEKKYAGKPEVLESLDAYFGEILDTPFSEKLIEQSVKRGLKDLNANLADIVIKHYTVYDYTKRSLSEKLVEEAGLSGREAEELADAVENEFDRIATKKKQELIGKTFSKKERKKPEVKSLEEELIRMTNLGAFNEDELVKAYGDKMGWPKLTPEQVKNIETLANKVQEAPDGFKKFRAVEDLLSYQASIPGISGWDILQSIWYANILSGQNTQLVNLIGNLANTTALAANAIAQNPKSARFIATGAFEGFKRGLMEAKATWQTGYSPIRGKVEVPATLERTEFWGRQLNPASYLKYVRRLMVASDVIMFEAQKEMRAYQLAWKQAAMEDKIEPTQSMKDRALDILNKNDQVVADAQEKAQLEYEKEVADIEASDASKAEKDKKLKAAGFDKERRVYELVEEARSGDILEESASFAARGTYNYKPEGALGALANAMNKATERVKPLKYIVPFTNIIANVANESINYTPWGFARAQREGSVFAKGKKDFTEQDKIDLTTKAIIGTSLMVAAYVLSQPMGDDDEPYMEITANGTGDYRKNYELQESGWQPYSIRVGDKWYSYQFTPLMLGLGFIGQIRDFEKYRNAKMSDVEFLTKVSAAAGYTMKSLFDMSFLSSLNSTLSAAMDPRNEDRLNDLFRQMKSTAKGVVIPSLYTQGAKEVENWFDIPAKEVRDTYMGDLLRDIPVARDQYFDKINALGEPVIPNTNKIVSSVKKDKIWDLIAEKRAFIGVPSPKTVTVYDPKQKKERLLTQEEFYRFAKMRGEYIRKAIEDHYTSLKKKSPEEAQEIIKDYKSKATKRAKYKLFHP